MDTEDEQITYPLSAYVGAKEAAYMLGITQNRVYEHIHAYRLPAIQRGKQYYILIQDVKKFEAHPTGRKRTKPTLWRAYQGDVKVPATRISVQVRAGQQKRLREKLQAICKDNRHLFPGTIARFVLPEDEQLGSIDIFLYWKSSDMPDKATRQNELHAFQAELEDVLDWKTAQERSTEALLYT